MSIRTQIKNKLQQKANRQNRVRAKIAGTAARLRLSVFRSNRHIFAQLIDDQKGTTIAVCSDMKAIKEKKEAKKGELTAKCSTAFEVGKAIAQKAQELKAKQVVFDRGSYRYHGRVKSLAEGARQGGLEF